MKSKIIQRIKESIVVKQEILEREAIINTIYEVTQGIIETFKNGGKVLLCGNGGSAADAQHIAAELAGKFYLERAGLFACALHTNTSYLTAVANDYSYEETFARLVRAQGREGDWLMGISTSGKAKNVINAVEAAKKLKMYTLGLTGENGGPLALICDYVIKVPSSDTPRIQEAHILMGHIICELVEEKLFKSL